MPGGGAHPEFWSSVALALTLRAGASYLSSVTLFPQLRQGASQSRGCQDSRDGTWKPEVVNGVNAQRYLSEGMSC